METKRQYFLVVFVAALLVLAISAYIAEAAPDTHHVLLLSDGDAATVHCDGDIGIRLLPDYAAVITCEGGPTTPRPTPDVTPTAGYPTPAPTATVDGYPEPEPTATAGAYSAPEPVSPRRR